jgi:hypothetical protein
MKMPNAKIQTAEDYMSFVEKYITLLDQQMAKAEKWASEKDFRGVAQLMPALISLVNTVGYFRGQGGMFVGIRPSADQSKLYDFENIFEKRLNALIDMIMLSNERQYYEQRLNSYYIGNRTKNPNIPFIP